MKILFFYKVVAKCLNILTSKFQLQIPMDEHYSLLEVHFVQKTLVFFLACFQQLKRNPPLLKLNEQPHLRK